MAHYFSLLSNFAIVQLIFQKMTLLEAIQVRHSVRHYKDQHLSQEVVTTLKAKIDEINSSSGLHIQLILNEPNAYSKGLAYGTFKGVSNYFVMAGQKTKDLDEKIGYYGEQLVLLAQSLGLNTCWTGLSYKKIKGTYTLNTDEKIACYIALGYGKTQGVDHKRKTYKDVSNSDENSPKWFIEGVKAALLAPTAINQQKFYFELISQEGKPKVIAKRGFSIVGYTWMDLGIAKLHFEIGAGKENFEWAN